MNVKAKIGQRVRVLREKRGLTQQDLAYAAELDRSYVASIETGQRNVAIVNIEKLATALDVSMKDFFNDSSFK